MAAGVNNPPRSLKNSFKVSVLLFKKKRRKGECISNSIQTLATIVNIF